MHYQVLGLFIIKTAHDNELELQKINEFLNSEKNPNRNLVSNNVSSTLRRDEIVDRPLRRPTTPMTNLSSTSNSQIFNQGKGGSNINLYHTKFCILILIFREKIYSFKNEGQLKRCKSQSRFKQ